jgi:hypothetical protein
MLNINKRPSLVAQYNLQVWAEIWRESGWQFEHLM